MNDFFNGFKGKLVIAIFVIMLGFLLQTASTGSLSTLSSKIIGTISIPFNSITSSIQNTVNRVLDKFQKTSILIDENKDLKQEVSKLNNKIIDYDSVKNENEHLKDTLQIQKSNPNFQMVNALVVNRDMSDKFYSFILNKGSKDGIKIKNAVITKNGLVGLVTEVSEYFSIVTSILDPKINIGAYGTVSNNSGILTGDHNLIDEKKLNMAYISKTNNLNDGDIIATSGIGKVFPRGLMVGHIEKIFLENDGLSMTAIVKPAVDIESITNVQIVTGF